MDQDIAFQEGEVTNPDFTFGDLYLFRFVLASANPRFQGYIRDFSVVMESAESISPASYFYYNYYYQCGTFDPYCVRMDEQYTKLMVNYANMNIVPMPDDINFDQDSAASTLCSTGYAYNSDTSQCQRNVFV